MQNTNNLKHFNQDVQANFSKNKILFNMLAYHLFVY